MTAVTVEGTTGATRATRLLAVSAALMLGFALVWLAAAPATARAAKALSGTMVVNGGAQSTTSPTATVVAQVRGAKTMRYRNPDGSFTAWETYVVTKALGLGADGTKVVEGQFRGSNGARVTLQTTILLDSTGPTTTSDYDGAPRTTVAVTLTASDALSDVGTTWYRLDGSVWREGTTTTLRAFRKKSGLPAGPHTLEFYSTDVLGNVGPTGSSVIVLQ